MTTRTRPLVLTVLALAASAACALPQDAKPTFGQTRVTRPDGSTLVIDQATPRAGIDWASFSIGASETVRVQQPGASSVLVNRVTGLDPSVILGRLQSNGRVFLTNPRGVIFGQGAQVDVGGLVATTLKLGDADAQAGRWWLAGSGGEGSVVNHGRITSAGTVALVAPQVTNDGSISAARVALGAVGEVQVDLDGDGLILLNARAADAAKLEQRGSVQAGGRAELIAAARGELAGTVLNLGGAVTARGLRGEGGEIVIDGGPLGITAVGGTVDASSATARGGDVTVLGQNVLLDGSARIDAGGASGGGRVRVGGGWQGADAALRNSERLTVMPGAHVDASATQAGNGGEVVLWSDRRTRFFGSLAAEGGPAGGDGGRAEVSGKQLLEFAGSASLKAPRGAAGRLLLDPLDIVIDGSPGTATAAPLVAFLDDAAGSPVFSAAAVSTLLASGDVEMQALDTVTVSAAISGASRLTLRAGNDITVSAPISTQGLVLSAGDPGGSGSGFGKVSASAALNAGAGNLVITNNGGSGVHFLGANLAGNRLDITGSVALTAAQSWTFSDTASGSFISGAIGGSDTLTLAGSGLTIFTADNSGLAGGIQVNAGRLALMGSGNAGGPANGVIAVASGARLDLAGITLAARPTLAAGATIGADNSAGGIFGAGVVLGGDATVDGRAGDITLGVVSQVGAPRSITTLGTVTLGAASTYTGSTTVSSGTLTLDGTSQSSALVANGGLLRVPAANTLLAAPTLQANAGGTIRINGNETVSQAGTAAGGTLDIPSGTLTVGNGGTLAGALTGAGALVQTGGAMVIAGTSTMSGGLQVNGGTLRIDGATSLAATPLVTGSGAVVDITTDATLHSLAGGGVFNLAGHTLTFGGGNVETTYGGTLNGPGTLVKAGSAGVSFFGVFAGDALVVQGGTFGLSGGQVQLPGTPAVTIGAGASFVTGDAETVRTVSGTGSLHVGLGPLTTGSADSTFTGPITGNSDLVKAGAGVFTISGNNTSGGNTVVSGGTLVAASPASLGVSGVVVNSGGTLELGSGTLTLPLTLAGTGSAGQGALVVPGTLTASTLTLSNNATVNVGGTLAVSGNVAESRTNSSLTKSGAGTLVLGGGGLWTGSTTVAAGTLQVGGGNALPDTSLTLAAGSTLALSSSEAVGALGGAGSVALGANTLTVNGGSFGGSIAGSGSLVISGGTFALGGTVAALGGTTVSGGTLALAAPERLADTAPLTVATTGTVLLAGTETVGSLALAGTLGGTGRLVATSATLTAGTVGGGVALAAPVTSAGNSTVDGTIEGDVSVSSGTLALGSAERIADSAALQVVSGATLLLGGNESVASVILAGDVSGTGTLAATTLALAGGTYSGALAADTTTSTATGTLAGTLDTRTLQLAGGTLTLGGTQRLLNTPALAVGTGTTLVLGGDETLGALSGSGTVQLGSATLATSGSATFAGSLSGPGTLLKQGPGLLRLTGSNTHGATQITGGVLVVGDGATAGSLGSGPVQAGGELRFDRSDSVTLPNAISGSGPVVFAGSGRSTLVQPGAWTGGTDIAAGTVALNSASAGLGSGAVTLRSGATLELTNGAVLPNALTLAGTLANPGGSATVSGPVTLTGNAALNASNLTLSGGIGESGGSFGITTSGIVAVTADSTYSGTTTVNAGTLTVGAGGITGTVGHGPIVVNGTLRLWRSYLVTVDNTLAGSGTLQLDTAGGVRLEGSSTFAGSTLVNAGTLTVAGTATTGSGTIVLQPGTVLDIVDGARVDAAVTGNGGALANSSGSGTLAGTLALAADSTIGSTATGLDLTGTVSGSAGFTKTGSGRVALSGNNTFGGAVTVAAGTLAATSANALGATTQGTTVQAGAALDAGAALAAEPLSLAGSGIGGAGVLLGSGSVAGPVTLAADAAIGGNVTVGGAIGGAGRALTKVGTSTVTLAGANGYSGTTTVSAGTLALRAVDAIAASAVVVDGGTLDIGTFDNHVPALQLLAGNVNGTSGVLTSATAIDARQGTIGANLAGGLAKSGTGTVSYTASRSLAGNLSVSAGTLDVQGFDVTAGGAQLLGGRIDGSTGSLASASPFDLQAGTVNARLAGASGLVKSGNGSVVMSAAATYAGSTAVNGGSLILTAAERLPDGSAVSVAPAGTLAIGGNETVASLVLQGTLAGSGTLTAASYDLQGGNVVADLGAGTLTSSGSSTLGGRSAAGSVTLGGGTLTLGAAGRFSNAPTVTLPGGALLALGGDEAVGTLTGSGTVALGSGVLSAGGAADFTFDGAFSGVGGFTKTGAGTMTLTAAQGYGGATTVAAGTLRLPAAERLPDATALTVAAPATLHLAGGDETVATATIAGRLLGPGTLIAGRYALAGGTIDTNLGPGVLVSTGASRLNGTAAATTVDVQGGTLTLGAAQRLAAAAAVSVQPGATLALTGDQGVQTLALAGILTGSGTFTALGGYQLDAGSRVDVPLGAGTLNVDGNATLNQTAGATVVNVNSGTLTVSNSGDLADQATVNVAGGGTLAVQGTQTVASLTLAGSVAGGGTLAVNTLQTAGDAAVQTTVQVAAPVTVSTGTLTVGNGATGGALVAPSTTVDPGATLAFNRSDTVTVGSVGGSGALRQDGSGTLALAGNVSGLQAVAVSNGNLALAGGGQQLSDGATVSVARNGTLTLGSGGQTVGSLTLEGRLAGAGATLQAGSYTLAGGTAEANLGSGTLVNTGGTSVVTGTVGAGSVSVAGGSLAVAGNQALLARPGLDVQAGATLTLTGAQTVGAVTNAGTLVTGSTLDAASIASPGALRAGGSISTSGGQTYGGALTAGAARVSLTAGGDIVALNTGNDFGDSTLALQARSVRLYGGGSELRLVGLALAGGDSSVTAANRLLLAGATTLTGGTLVLQANGTPTDGGAASGASGQAALLPDPANGAASGTRLVYAAPVISQTPDGGITTAAGTVLRLRAAGGGSIELDDAPNRLAGQVSAISGNGGGFALPTGQGSVRLSRVSLEADALNLSADDGTANGLAQPQATTGGDAIRADVVALAAASIQTAPGAWIRARLPYSVNQGPNTSAPALVIDTAAAPAGGRYGSADSPLAVSVGEPVLGIGGLFMAVLPGPEQGGAANQRLYFSCGGCSTPPVYLWGGDPLAAQTWVDGALLGTAPLAASVINNSTTLLENARRNLFEAAVRTENVAPRLRAGVIAEVGVGRPATEGAGGAARPALCDAKAGSLDC